MSIVLSLTYWKPTGLINFDKLEGADLLIAEREGVANCTTRLRLKTNNKFNERSICFGISKISGNYFIKHDTIFFSDKKLERNKKYYQFAVIEKTKSQNEKIIADLVLYNSLTDNDPNRLWITKNDLIK